MDITFIIVVVAFLLLIFISGYLNERRSNHAYIEKLKKDYGQKNSRKYSADELKTVKGFFEYKSPDNCIDDITWNDLDMWSVYKQMNYCKSSSGDEYLYYLLRCPQLQETDWSSFEDKVNGLSLNEHERVKISVCLNKMGRSGKYSLFNYIEKLDKLNGYTIFGDILLDVLYIPAIALCFINGLWGAVSIVALVIINVATYFKKKNKIEPYIICFNYINNVLINSMAILETNIDILKEENEILKGVLKDFKAFKRFYFVVSGNAGNGPAGVLLDYFKMISHIDLIKFKSLLAEIKINIESIEMMVATIGKIDCYLSVGEYRNYLGDYCIPVLKDNDAKLSAEDIYHPLLDNPVCNCISTKEGIILTGSNASGKSTFLKTVALNILLSQSIHTTCAKNYSGAYYALYTSLNLKDSISSGDSYYMTEIKAIKRIIDASNDSGIKVAGFVDEVLRGTNTTERIAASSTILHNMKEKGIMVFAATHDLELTGILEKDFANYHFEEAMEGDDVSFPYKLAEGKALSRNAIKLLGRLGLDGNISDAAQKMVNDFEEKGMWSIQ